MNWYFRHINLEKFASKEIMYHGTSLKNLQSIMSQGLIPSPKKRVWQEDPEASSRTMSRKSFEGIYLTNNFMTAKSSATRASGASDGLIIAVQAETRSLALDEDNLVYSFQHSLSNLYEGYIMNEYLTQSAYIEYKLGKIDDKFDKVADNFLTHILRSVEEPRRSHVKDATKSLVIEIMKSLLIRQVSYILKEVGGYGANRFRYEMEEAGLDINDIPSIDAIEIQTRKLIDQATRKFALLATNKRLDSFQETARSLTPIGFSGANKILCVMSFEVNRADPKERTYTLTFHYSSSPAVEQKLLSDWKQYQGYKFTLGTATNAAGS